jgi:hypothetical protein
MVYAEPMLTRQWRKAIVSLSPALVIAALGVSCEDQGKYQGSISKVHDATAVVIASAKATYVGLNKAERDHYVELQLAQRKPIDPDELARVQVLDTHETASRISSLDVLAKYSDLLVQLAATQTPASVQSKTTDLQQSLATLSGDVDKLAGTNSAQFQARTKSVLPLLGTALQAFVNAKTVAALKKATVDAMKPVNDFIGALEADMRLAHARERNFLSGRRSEAYVHYRADLEAKADGTKLRSDADSILLLESQWETFESESSIAGLEAMKQAYDALVEFVRKPKPSGADYNTLLGAVDSFVNTARQVGLAVQTFAAK